MNNDLEEQFQSIRSQYFPTWRDGSNWQIVEYEGNGYCDSETKTIKVGGSTGDYTLPVLIIHEIAHAVTADGHGDKWVNCMREAAARAAELSDQQHAVDLQKHIEWTINNPDAYDVTPDEVHHAILSAAKEQPHATYENVVRWVAEGYGQDLKTFEAAFPQARQSYDKAHYQDLRSMMNRVDANDDH